MKYERCLNILPLFSPNFVTLTLLYVSFFCVYLLFRDQDTSCCFNLLLMFSYCVSFLLCFSHYPDISHLLFISLIHSLSYFLIFIVILNSYIFRANNLYRGYKFSTESQSATYRRIFSMKFIQSHSEFY